MFSHAIMGGKCTHQLGLHREMCYIPNVYRPLDWTAVPSKLLQPVHDDGATSLCLVLDCLG